MKLLSKAGFIPVCDEGFEFDCAPGVCARELGQRIVASKQISGRARFMSQVLNRTFAFYIRPVAEENLSNLRVAA